jgi:hypothetical protein
MLNGNHIQRLFDYCFMKYDATTLATEIYSCFCCFAVPSKCSEHVILSTYFQVETIQQGHLSK